MCRGCRKVVKTVWQVVRPWTHYLPTGLDAGSASMDKFAEQMALRAVPDDGHMVA